jgi:hypothetical protein
MADLYIWPVVVLMALPAKVGGDVKPNKLAIDMEATINKQFLTDFCTALSRQKITFVSGYARQITMRANASITREIHTQPVKYCIPQDLVLFVDLAPTVSKKSNRPTNSTENAQAIDRIYADLWPGRIRVECQLRNHQKQHSNPTASPSELGHDEGCFHYTVFGNGLTQQYTFVIHYHLLYTSKKVITPTFRWSEDIMNNPCYLLLLIQNDVTTSSGTIPTEPTEDPKKRRVVLNKEVEGQLRIWPPKDTKQKLRRHPDTILSCHIRDKGMCHLKAGFAAMPSAPTSVLPEPKWEAHLKEHEKALRLINTDAYIHDAQNHELWMEEIERVDRDATSQTKHLSHFIDEDEYPPPRSTGHTRNRQGFLVLRNMLSDMGALVH